MATIAYREDFAFMVVPDEGKTKIGFGFWAKDGHPNAKVALTLKIF
jgi:hypothetical protein